MPEGLKEEDRPTPEDPYGIAKFAFELDLQAAKATVAAASPWPESGG